jgi:hypothetical protein
MTKGCQAGRRKEIVVQSGSVDVSRIVMIIYSINKSCRSVPGTYINIMIRQDHLMGRPRNVVSTYICSIGTIRGEIPPGAPNHETIRWNEDVVITGGKNLWY